ncbi:ATP-binding cassette, subfamily B [Fervidobacterium changbaicum]|uniref:ABC transporter ATP-binding protein/permease n=2 Tax=Fervidobacterium TaxID=2422 RepID=A0AAI8GCI6_FERIS|nr:MULTISPECIES: ABC transporter ATP-binding protein [Fervidobacterium]AMW32235.1 ABC transporter ATP-binding protein/permease [Fervidobacterium islandicum]QAV32426.1 ABC transporter ATP-binding protein [Fervidobacterium changbaicum]SDH19138.1 ATP-binding cassette, subfamily B [Fervidobacterium changbaicum]
MSEEKRMEQPSRPNVSHAKPVRPMGPGGPGGPSFARGGEKPKEFKNTTRKLLKYLRPHMVGIIIVFALTIVATILTIKAPKVLGQATTEIFRVIMLRKTPLSGFLKTKMDFDKISSILLNVAILYSVAALLNFLQGYMMAGITQKVVRKMREDINNKLERLPLKFYDGRSHGDIISRVTNDVDLISNTLQQSLTQFISGIVTIVGITYMMITINLKLTLLTLITLPLSALVTVHIAKKSQKYFAAQQKYLGEITGRAEEVYGGFLAVKTYGRENDEVRRFKEINEKLYKESKKAQFISGIIMPVMNFIGNLGYIIVAVGGGILVTKKAITVGDVQAFIQYSRQFNQPIVQIANIVNMIQSTLAAAERVFEILEEEEEAPDKPDAIELEKVQGDVKFENVKFSYVPDKPLIENLNIDVKSGQMVAIVGPTGAGKTTLVNLMMRFYEIQGGSIKVDGIDIRDIKKYNLRKHFGMVLQDTWLFSGTIMENIAYGKDGATEEEIINAAKMAHVHHFIMALPDGYDTVIGEDSSNISQGEKQLITIARAFLANPDILILDEATSNVDTLTEVYIQRAMRDIMKGRTSFVVAHRLSTIKNADIILVMNEGKIIEIGKHEELLLKNGFYAELYRSQFLGAVVETA